MTKDKFGWDKPRPTVSLEEGLNLKINPGKPTYEDFENDIASLEKLLGRKHVEGEVRRGERLSWWERGGDTAARTAIPRLQRLIRRAAGLDDGDSSKWDAPRDMEANPGTAGIPNYGADENDIAARVKYRSRLLEAAKKKGLDISRYRPTYHTDDSWYRILTEEDSATGPGSLTEARYTPRRPRGKKSAPEPLNKEIAYELAKAGREGIYDEQDRETKRQELRKAYMEGYPVNEQVRSRDRRIMKLGGIMPRVWGAFGMPGMSQIAANIDANIADSDREYERRYDLADRKRRLIQEGFGADEGFADYKDRMQRDTFKVDGKLVDPDLAALLPEGRMQAVSQAAEKLDPVMGGIVSGRMARSAAAPEIEMAMKVAQLRYQQNSQRIRELELALRTNKFASQQEQQAAMNQLREAKMQLQRDEYELSRAKLEEQKAAREATKDPAKQLLDHKGAFDEWAAESGGYNPYMEEAESRGYIEPRGSSLPDIGMKLGLRAARKITE